MPSDRDRGAGRGLTTAERERLRALRGAESLSDLVALTDAGTEHGAYAEAKREWYDLRGIELPRSPPGDGIPGRTVAVGGTTFHVHGITHADTPAEGEFLRGHVAPLLDAGAAVYCEQGIRRMYFEELPDVCGMDDYRWAMDRCAELDGESHAAGLAFEGIGEDLDSLVSEFRQAAFSLIESRGGRYGEVFERALGDLVSDLLVSHEGMATGDEFESFALTRRAAEDPARLADLQRYYERSLLPQPIEREWLRRHDPELEIVTHARNERMADYALYHNDDAPEVHLIVGAAHQPGVAYYLERHRDGERDLGAFEPLG